MIEVLEVLSVEDAKLYEQIRVLPIEEIEKELRAEGVDLERFERVLREKIVAKRKEISKMTLKEAVDDFGKKEETEDLPRMITGDQGEVWAGETSRQIAEVTVDDAQGDESLGYYEALLEILVHVKDAPLTAESAQEILERHGLEGLMVLVSDDQPEIQEETAAIDNLFDDLIDRDVLSRELST